MTGISSFKVKLYCILACGILRFAEGSVECAPTQFKCTSGKCIGIHTVCDGDNDCGDNYDEQVCDPFHCPPLAFQCPNGECIPRFQICNGHNNCGDNSDEQVCTPHQCHPSAFQCLNGKCISRFWFCQGIDQCGDNSDQIYCNKTTNEICPADRSECANKRRCIPSGWMCDGYPDCTDGSDERNCGSFECAPTEFKCVDGNCTAISDVCDGFNDCGDNSDEQVCDPFHCPLSAFQCPNGKCIARKYICDGRDHCGDNFDEQICEPYECHPSAFQCSNGKCRSRYWFCTSDDECGDNSDEQYCNKPTNEACPPDRSECANKRRCIPSRWVCDGYPDCTDGSDERNCDKTLKMTEIQLSKTKLRSYILSRRKPGSRRDHWGPQVHRVAVALHLADNSTFAPGNSIGEEIRYELTMQLLYRLPRDRLSSQELALYIHAMLVSCLDPRDFYGGDLVRELRRRVEATGNYTNPFLILVLCNAGDSMTAKDVQRVTTAYDSQHRPFWTDSQALSCMALSCIASRNSGLVDERSLMDLLQELKKRQFRNGTVDNFRTTALVTQALFIHESYKKDFDLDSAIKVLVDGLNGSMSLLNAYYALPVLYVKSLLNVTSSHCSKQPVDEDEALQKALDVQGETITVQYSVWMGDEINVGRTWRLRMLVNSTIYDAIETAAKTDNRQKVQYNVVDGKPYVASLNGKEDDPEMGTFWFIYLKPLDSDEKPTLVKKSPVDMKLTPNQEIILWYRRATWSDQNFIQKPVASS